jgi:hypothetical protein
MEIKELDVLVNRIAVLEAEVQQLKNGTIVSPPPLVPGNFDKLVIKGVTSPPSLKIISPFGDGPEFSNIQGDLSLKLYRNDDKQMVSGFRIQDSEGNDVFTFKQDGTIKLDKIPLTYISWINPSKTYYFPILDEVGNQVFIQVVGENITNTIK